MRCLPIVLSVTVLFASAAGPLCAQEAGRGTQKTVLIFAAASTSTAIDEIKERFAKETGVRVLASYGSSATLAKQIANGADADVFISADTQWADYLAHQGLVAQQQTLLGNRLVVIVPADSKLEVQSPKDLLAADVQHMALGDPDSVPAGKYAKRALVKLGLWDELKQKVAAAEDVRHVLAYVETGAAEAGIVYATDAAVSKKVRVVSEISESLTGPIRYPLVLLKHGQGNPAAESFNAHLALPESLKIFRKYGFVPLIDIKTTGKSGQ